MKLLTLPLFAVVGAIWVVAAQSLPPLRSPTNPISQHVEPYYVTRAFEETATPNLVTAILADYRSYDTFGEMTVIFAAGLSCYLLLRRFHG